MSIKDIKNKSQSLFEKLKAKTKELDKQAKKSRNDDDRFWKLTTDESGNGSAVIRFLPSSGKNVGWIRYWEHYFKVPHGDSFRTYWENSRTSIGDRDPVYEGNAELYETGKKENIEIAKSRGRKENFVSTILVVKDPAKPENNGKVFLFKYGKKIMNKIRTAMEPDEDLGIESINPFDYFEGANFVFKAKRVDKYPNYDDSTFASKSKIGSDEEIEKIDGLVYNIDEFLEESFYEPYEVLKKKFDFVTGNNVKQNQDKPKEEKSTKSTKQKEVEEVDISDNIEDSLDDLLDGLDLEN
jgi:hypothetical protein